MRGDFIAGDDLYIVKNWDYGLTDKLPNSIDINARRPSANQSIIRSNLIPYSKFYLNAHLTNQNKFELVVIDSLYNILDSIYNERL